MRETAERFVYEAFRRVHRARVQTFMPTLLLFVDANDELHAVAGCRAADEETLFLERYLTRPIETVLADRIAARPARSEIVEIGNFAARSSRLARRFICRVPFLLLERRFSWVTFTGTAPVRRIVEHLGARCIDLGCADGACASEGADDWGRYYRHDPHVMAGYLPRARRIAKLRDAAYAD